MHAKERRKRESEGGREQASANARSRVEANRHDNAIAARPTVVTGRDERTRRAVAVVPVDVQPRVVRGPARVKRVVTVNRCRECPPARQAEARENNRLSECKHESKVRRNKRVSVKMQE
jgi:hypothetical protein